MMVRILTLLLALALLSAMTSATATAAVEPGDVYNELQAEAEMLQENTSKTLAVMNRAAIAGTPQTAWVSLEGKQMAASMARQLLVLRDANLQRIEHLLIRIAVEPPVNKGMDRMLALEPVLTRELIDANRALSGEEKRRKSSDQKGGSRSEKGKAAPAAFLEMFRLQSAMMLLRFTRCEAAEAAAEARRQRVEERAKYHALLAKIRRQRAECDRLQARLAFADEVYRLALGRKLPSGATPAATPKAMRLESAALGVRKSQQ